MGIQRAVVKGTFASVVQVRNVFTCDVVPVGGDTSAILWSAYLNALYDAVEPLLSGVYETYEYETYLPAGGQWELLDTVTFNHTGEKSGDYLPNSVALVFIGKALGIRHFGRKFFGPIPESVATSNGILSTMLPDAALTLAAYVTEFTGLGGGTITPGVVDKNGDFHAFVGGVMSSLLGSMRRRKPGNGI